MPEARPEERRDDFMHERVAQVWAEPLADLGPTGLFRLGLACLDAGDELEDPARRDLLATVALALLGYAGRHDEDVGDLIARLCAREQQHGENQAETARVIAELQATLGFEGPDRTGGS